MLYWLLNWSLPKVSSTQHIIKYSVLYFIELIGSSYEKNLNSSFLIPYLL